MQGPNSPMINHPDLEDLLGFQLKLLQVVTDQLARKALAEFDISPARVAAMMFIDANPCCNQTALGAALAVNRASAMKLVNFLEARDLVKRSPGNDPRAHALNLTERGDAALRRMTAALKAVDGEVLAALDPKEAEQFLRSITKLRKSLSSNTWAAPSRTGSRATA